MSAQHYADRFQPYQAFFKVNETTDLEELRKTEHGEMRDMSKVNMVIGWVGVWVCVRAAVFDHSLV